MSSDTILKDKDGNLYSFDNLATQRWLEGHEQGAAVAAKYLLDKSVEAFRERQDDKAKLLRDLSDEILSKVCSKLKENAQRHETEYPYKL